MTALILLIPVALFFAGGSLAVFLWAMRSGQYDDLDGAAVRVLIDPAEETVNKEMPKP